jgi:hypothetical protein
LGEIASPAVQDFAETGSTSSLDTLKAETKASNATNATVTISNMDLVFDGFTAPPIESGVGMSHANLFLDGNHSMVRKFFIVI